MAWLRSVGTEVRELPFPIGGCLSMLVAMLVAPLVVAPVWVVSGDRIEHYFGRSFLAYAMVAACVGLLLFVALRGVLALVSRHADAEKPGLLVRFAVAVGRFLFVLVALAAAIVFGSFSLMGHPRDGDDFTYSDHFWESLAARNRFAQHYVDLPPGATSLRYRISTYDDTDGSGMEVEVVAEVAPRFLPEWTRGCTPTSREEIEGGPASSHLYEPPPSARFFDCTEVTGTMWTRRIVDDSTHTVAILTGARR